MRVLLEIAKQLDQQAFERVVVACARGRFGTINPSNQRLSGPKRAHQVVVELPAARGRFGDQSTCSMSPSIFSWRSNGTPPGGGMIAPFDQLPSGVLELLDGRRLFSHESRHARRNRARRSPGAPWPAFPETRHGTPARKFVWPVARTVPRRRDRPRPPLAARAESARKTNEWCRWMLLPDARARVRVKLARASLVVSLARQIQFLAQPQLQFAGGLVGERHRDDVIDGSRAAGEHRYDASDQLGGFAGAGGGFHQQAFAERCADALACRAIVQLRMSTDGRHGRFRTSTSGSNRSRCLRLDARFFVWPADRPVVAHARTPRFAARLEGSRPPNRGRWLRARVARRWRDSVNH